MINRYSLFFLLLFLAPAIALAQAGKLSGKVTDAETKETLIGAAVKVFSGGQLKGGGVSDINGNFSIAPLNPGAYDVEVSMTGYNTRKVEGVRISFEQTTSLNFVLTTKTLETKTVTVKYEKPLVSKDETSSGARITSEYITRIGTRDLNTMITAATPTVVSADQGGGLFIKGNRSGDNAVFINGVRQFGSSLPPPEAIEEVAVITGGIPAEYGDALGGIINYTTKNAASKFTGGVQMETSRPFNRFQQDFLSFSLSGPLIKTKEYTNASGTIIQPRTLVGFFSTIQFSSNRDASPSAYGYWRVRPDVLDRYRENPTRTIPGGGVVSRANFLTRDSLEQASFIDNGRNIQLQYNGTFDYQPTENILVSLGGNFTYARGRNAANFRWFNAENNPVSTNFNYNAFLRFRQSFPNSSENALVKNIYYTLQFDISDSWNSTMDARHKENLALYNYYGRFSENLGDITGNGLLVLNRIDSTGGSSSQATITGPYVIRNGVTGINFQASDANRDLVNWNNSYLRLRPGFLNRFGANTIAQMDDEGFGINGGGLPGIGYDFGGAAVTQFGALGATISPFNKGRTSQYRVTAQAAAEIKKHTIKVGFQYEQRVVSSYSAATNLYTRGRAYANQQFTGDRFGLLRSTVENGVSVLELAPVRRVDPISGRPFQGRGFDTNLRRRLGLDPNAAIWLNVDDIDPSLMTLDLFSVTDILDGGTNPMASWSGFDVYGNRLTTRPAFEDFFLDTINRPIDSWRPIYIAGYIEDKFEIEDLTIRLGLRVDRFDANQPVLRDQWSLNRLTSVSETQFDRFSPNSPDRPSNIGDDYTIYVNRSAEGFDGSNQSSFTVLGYRQGNRLFRADGTETTNARELESNGNLFQWYDVTGIQNDPIRRELFQRNRITTDAFEAYKPQVNWLPRVSFSFPISDKSLFFAHYDVLTQRPLNFGGGANFGSPINYYALSQNGNTVNQVLGQVQYIPNPNLRPQRKIDYEIGFQQALNDRSALKITAAYSETRDLIAQVRINNANIPGGAYNTDGNQDFGVIKSLAFQYDLRQTENLTFNASYTLQFAETSASGFAAAQLNNTRNPNLRNTLPASFDSRHQLKGNIDYRLYQGQGPRVGKYKVFENFGVNFTAIGQSGFPYTRFDPTNFVANQILGQQNGSRLPFNFRTDIRVNKEFYFKRGEGKRPSVLNVFVYVTNLLDRRNILGVYPRTGSATDDGYLVSDLGRRNLAAATAGGIGSQETALLFYNLTLLNPDLVSLPRQVRLGATFSF